ncbi:oligosaccharide flippase family protein [Aeromicrobium fastidiosum]|uniref:oligosaccharide flippase family protein n=1 Tax=Aeromicrobium fastidiosum TaxID=52699 RepID=UPI0024DF1BB6|nr:oligosaccharide flippase family protein [Aeromicrobium fastidiosum]
MGTISRRVVTTLIGNALGPLASLLTAPMLARGLGVDGRGEVAAAVAPLVLGATIATVGLPNAATYFVARAPSVSRYVSRFAALMLVISGVIATTTIFSLRGWLSDGDVELARMIAVAALLVVPTMQVVLLQAVAAGLNQWKRVLAERAISSFLRVLTISLLLLNDRLTPLSAIAVLATAPLIGGLAYIHPRRRTDPVNTPANGDLLKYGMRIWVGAISGILLSRIDQTMIVPLSDTEQLGYYAVAVSISELALVANTSIREVMFTNLSTQFDRHRLTVASRVSTWAALGVGMCTAAACIGLLPLVFGSDFAPAIPVSLILIIAVVVGNPGSMAGVGLTALGYPGRRSVSLIIACVANVACLLVLVPSLGANGAAIATLVGNLVSSNINIGFMWRLTAVRPLAFYELRLRDLALVKTQLFERRGG